MTCLLLKTRDKLYFDWKQSKGWITPEDIADDYDISLADIEPLDTPIGEFRESYPSGYVAGIFDALGEYRPHIFQSSEHTLEYGINIRASVRRGGVHPAFAAAFSQYCEQEGLTCNNQQGATTLDVNFLGLEPIRQFAENILEYLLIKYEYTEYVLEYLAPKFEKEEHLTKQGILRPSVWLRESHW